MADTGTTAGTPTTRRAGHAGRHPRLVASLLALAALLAVVLLFGDAARNWWEAHTGQRPLLAARSWHYNLAKVDVDRLAGVDADVLVIDYARNGGKSPLPRGDVERLKHRSDGRARSVIAYMSIGEAEIWRYYWQKIWESDPTSRPDWLLKANCAWPGAWAVRYWTDSWKAIIFGAGDSYLRRIIDSGFDGVYLDRVDMYDVLKAERPDTRAQMIRFMGELARTARALKPGFLIIPQNAEGLLDDPAYRRLIDGLGKEELFYSEKATGVRNSAKSIKDALGYVNKLRADLKPIFVVEYLLTSEAIATTQGELRGLGFVPTFEPRNLDGSDPTRPVALASSQGTPEFTATNCDKSNSW